MVNLASVATLEAVKLCEWWQVSGNAAQGQQKTHTSLERVGFMFKVHRFGTLYFADVHEISMSRNLLIPLTFIGGASRIRTADLWIMIPSL